MVYLFILDSSLLFFFCLEIKGTALNILVIQSQQLPAILRKSEGFKNTAIPALMQMLMQIDKISL